MVSDNDNKLRKIDVKHLKNASHLIVKNKSKGTNIHGYK